MKNPPSSEGSNESAAVPEAAPASAESGQEPAPADTTDAPAPSSAEADVQPDGGDAGEGADSDIVAENRTITVTSPSKVLLKLDSKGNATDAAPVSSLEFTNAGSFAVRSDDPIKSWTVNGIRFEPAQPVNEFKVTNVTESIVLDIKTVRTSTAEAELDESKICKVTCKGCTFTYLSKGLRSVTEGEVPSGARIKVIADNSDLASGGYSVNGGEPESVGKASLQLTVTEDVTIVAGK